jgi:hypothetical protein
MPKKCVRSGLIVAVSPLGRAGELTSETRLIAFRRPIDILLMLAEA